MALGLTTPATATTLTSSQGAATDSLSAEPVTTLSAPSALDVYRDATDSGETYSMSARAPLTGRCRDLGHLLRTQRTSPEPRSTTPGSAEAAKTRLSHSTSMYVDQASAVALAKHDLVIQAFAYRELTRFYGRFGDSSPGNGLREEPRTDPAGQPSARDVEQGRRFAGLDMEYA